MILIVGQNPSSAKKAKKNDSLDRLLDWCTAWKLDKWDFMNCSDEPGDKYTIDFDRLKDAGQQFDKIIALGNVASNALKKVGVDHFKMPHPSPLNRQLNDKQFEKTMIEKCYNYIMGDTYDSTHRNSYSR
jgi:hypothetical protein